MSYRKVTFQTSSDDQREMLIALLGDIDFDHFEEQEHQLVACISNSKFSDESLKGVIEMPIFAGLQYNSEIVQEQNWNAIWEASYSPVVVSDKVGVRASFHETLPVETEIIIDPKMSFGTGHHETTSGMLELMSNISMDGKSVLDFGSGTGVLAIYAIKKGATEALAVDYDEWCFENCIENCEANQVSEKVWVVQGDHRAFENKQFDVILANINRNVLLDTAESIAQALQVNGRLFVSGILEKDKKAIIKAFGEFDLLPQAEIQNGNWLAIQLHSKNQSI